MQQQPVIAIILAGGQGTRLWPLTSINSPKQFIIIAGKTLLEHTLYRASKSNPTHIFIVTACIYEQKTVEIVSDFCRQFHATLCVSTHCDHITVLSEPTSRNTATAIAYSLQAVRYFVNAHQIGMDAVCAIFPADHWIEHELYWHGAVSYGVTIAAQKKSAIVLGAPATEPLEVYGYIERFISDRQADCPEYINQGGVATFHEKPSMVYAHELIQKGALYNCGVVIATATWLHEQFLRFSPAWYEQVITVYREYVSYNRYTRVHALLAYEKISCYSFDTLILEKVSNLECLSAPFAWMDLGSIAQFMAHAYRLRDERLYKTESGGWVWNELSHYTVVATTPNTLLMVTQHGIRLHKDVITPVIASADSVSQQLPERRQVYDNISITQ